MSKNEMATTETGVPAHLAALSQKYAPNAGLEDINQTDLKLPFFRIVQPTSKELIPGNEKYLDDAKIGDIIEGAITRSLFKEVQVIPLAVTKGYSEFKKQEEGGGFVGFHLDGSERVKAGIDEGEFNELATPEGTILKRTMQMFLLANPADGKRPQLGVMSFSGGGLTEMKKFLSYAVSLDLPLFAKQYTISTFAKNNVQHNSVTFRPDFNVNKAQFVSEELAKTAGAIYEQLDQQKMKAMLDATVEEDTPAPAAEDDADVKARVAESMGG